MEIAEKPQFTQMLTQTMGAYSKPLPESALLKAWWDVLAPFPLQIVVRAFAVYCDEEDRFAPVPAAIAKRCKLMDGRPSDDEAWAIALLSQDEADTVVWTQEIAEAFNVCAPVLNGGDEVGARMAFKDAYNRMVQDARIAGRPAKWTASLGWDVAKREAAVARAANAGLLPAPAVRAMLPNYSDAVAGQESCPEGLARVKEALAEMQAGWAAAATQRETALQAQREADAERKREIASQVAQYQRPDAA
jgi:hypothetical protein